MRRRNRRRMKDAAVVLVASVCLAVVVVVSGVVPVKASLGHWKVTRWFLDFASNRSIATYSAGIEVPPLDEPGMIRLGALTYRNNCQWCHGAPGLPRPPVAERMTPTPPRLTGAVSRWDDAELFFIVKHGIKFAGMPAWAAEQRDDEVWPVVAYLRTLGKAEARPPAGILGGPPLSTIAGDVDEPPGWLTERCDSCHGPRGTGSDSPRVPLLAEQKVQYLASALQSYRAGERYSGIMQPIAAGLPEGSLHRLARHYADARRSSDGNSSSPESDAQPVDAELIRHGRVLALQGDAARGIASCADCHGPADAKPLEDYPLLAGQPEQYLRTQLSLFESESRGGAEHMEIMQAIADRLKDRDREALAAYYSRQTVGVQDDPFVEP